MVRVCVKYASEEKMIETQAGKNLLELLEENQIGIDASCGGNGRCGKCRVKIGDEECLACKKLIDEDMEVEILNCLGNPENSDDIKGSLADSCSDGIFAAAIDLGSSTITVAIEDIEKRHLHLSLTGINHQKAFGADIISRIDMADRGKAGLLRATVQKDIISLLENAVNALGLRRESIVKIAIAANTAMMHLLMGWDVSSLAVSPFIPFNIAEKKLAADEVLGSGSGFSSAVILLPSVSAFIGADIVAGISSLNIGIEENVGFIDLGTNAEMAVISGSEIFFASAAAGPAFEGGNISMGMAGIEGAVYDVRISADRKAEIKTIGGTEAKGICGTGVISAIAQMLDRGMLDENGTFTEAVSGESVTIARTSLREIKIKQEDVHSILMAKAAVAAGFETLLHKAGISYSDLDHIYLAGSFARNMKIEDALRIGLIPSDAENITESIGNSSLRGALGYLENAEYAEDYFERIISSAHIVELSDEKYFEKRFIDNMKFFSYNE